MGNMVRGKLANTRAPIARPDGAAFTFVCPDCDALLCDGVDYTSCPACDALVDWIDIEPPAPVAPHARSRWYEAGATVLALALLAQLVAIASDPLGFAFVAPLALVVVGAAIAAVVGVCMSLGEIAALARDRATRVVHGLEHACIHVLLAAGAPALAGQTERGGFVVELANGSGANTELVARAARDAVRRVHAGEHELAYSRRCGTSLVVAVALAALAIVAGSVVGLVLGIPHSELVVAVAVATLAVTLAARTLGLLAQKCLTVSTKFTSAAIARVVQSITADGSRARYVVFVEVR